MDAATGHRDMLLLCNYTEIVYCGLQDVTDRSDHLSVTTVNGTNAPRAVPTRYIATKSCQN